MRIGIVVGSVREGRLGQSVGQWVAEQAAGRPGADYVVIDLKGFDLPVFADRTLPAMAGKHYDSPAVTRWSEAIDACDAYVFVTPEYNHGVPGAFKNAVDSLYGEWVGKAVGFVGYGAEGGVRAIEHWRQIVANFQMFAVRAQVSLSVFTEVADGAIQPGARRPAELATLLDAVERMAARLSA